MHRALLVLASLLGLIAGGCAAGTEKATKRYGPKCDVTSLGTVFKNPLAFKGRRFCGAVMAYSHGRVVELFPEGPPPADPFDTAMFLSADADRTVKDRMPSSGVARLYVEGRIDLQMPCYRLQPTGDTCVPYIHPIDLKVSRLEFD